MPFRHNIHIQPSAHFISFGQMIAPHISGTAPMDFSYMLDVLSIQ